VFRENVIDEKYKIIADFFEGSQERGRNFLYNLLTLIRYQEERINFARLVYLMARIEPGKDSGKEEKDAYKKFAGSVIEWVQTREDRRQMETAIILYVYHIRETEDMQ